MLLKNKLLSLANEHFFQNSFDIELQKPREQEKEKGLTKLHINKNIFINGFMFSRKK